MFDAEEKERKLTELGDPLERLSRAVDFEMLRAQLEDTLLPKGRKSNAGAKRYGVVMMFKLMVLQRYHNLSNEQAEFQIVDRIPFRRFLGLAEGDSEEDKRRKANKKRHKDTEARWTKMGGVNHFGYKNHIKGDTKSELILTQEVTAASTHDSQPTDALLRESDKGQPLFGDSAYVGQEETLEKYRMKDEMCEKGYCGHPLAEEQKESNREKSRTQCRVEHIFGFMEDTMHRLYIRTVGLARATAVIGLVNPTHNTFCYSQIVSLNILKK